MIRLSNLIKINWRVDARWRGDSMVMTDKTRSGRDLSLAFCLAGVGFSIQEIAYILLDVYSHGQARYLIKGRERAAMRCATKAVASVEESKAAMNIQQEDINEDDEQTLMDMLFAEAGK